MARIGMKPIILLGEARGDNEDRINSSFVGSSGVELLRMLSEAGVVPLTAIDNDYINKFYREGNPLYIDMVWKLHPEVFRTNVFQHHPPGNKLEYFCGDKASRIKGYPALIKGKYAHSRWQPELDRLGDELIQRDPNLIICLGNTALWAMAGQTGISKLRGTTSLSTHTVSGFKLLGTYHPAAILRQWELRPVTVMDFVKAGREAGYPEIRRTERKVYIPETVEDLHEFETTHLARATRVAVDIETSGNQITCIGFAPSRSVALVIPILDPRRVGRSYWPDANTELQVWSFIKGVLGSRDYGKTFQNGLYDIAFLWRAYGIAVYRAEEDTMLLHHALQPESLKSLGFLGSIYANEGAWKHERKGTQTIKRDE